MYVRRLLLSFGQLLCCDGMLLFKVMVLLLQIRQLLVEVCVALAQRSHSTRKIFNLSCLHAKKTMPTKEACRICSRLAAASRGDLTNQSDPDLGMSICGVQTGQYMLQQVFVLAQDCAP